MTSATLRRRSPPCWVIPAAGTTRGYIHKLDPALIATANRVAGRIAQMLAGKAASAVLARRPHSPGEITDLAGLTITPELLTHLELLLGAHNHARRLKTLRGLTPYGHPQVWTKERERFRLILGQ
jgi:hypothetical protein